MTMLARQFVKISLSMLSVAAALFAGAPLADAQTIDEATIWTVKGAGVYVRCGAAESYYPFDKVDDGELVKSTGEKFGWRRVVAVGPAFNESFGYIKYAKSNSAPIRLSSDGKSATTLGKTDIIAPNLDAKHSPRDSWKSLARLEADQKLHVLESTETDKEMIHKVILPEVAVGWISAAYLEPATDDQIAQFNDSLTATPEPANDSPTSAAPARQATSDESTSGVKPVDPMDAPIDAPISMDPVDDVPTAEPAPTSEPSVSTPPAAPEITMAPVSPKTETKVPTLEDLEAAYKVLQKQPKETAEVGPLRDLYLDLIKRSPGNSKVQRVSNARAEQLKIWSDIQAKLQELDGVKARMKMSAAEADAVRLAIERSSEYTAVGRIASSTIYDGKSLPKLLRIQDAATGRTLAYLQPDEQFELVNRIDTIVGIVGEKTYDDAMRLNIITPSRVEVLSPTQTAGAETTDNEPSPPAPAPEIEKP